MTDQVAPIVITEIDRLRLRPGDRLIAYADLDSVSHEQAQEVASRVRAALRLPDIPVAVCDRTWTITVIEAVNAKDAARGE